MRRLLLVAAVLAVLVYAALPPRPLPLPAPGVQLPASVRGVIHVHTRRSDGSGTPEQVARAVARAGLRFVILTDHGDGTRSPDAPAYYGDVLVIDAVEISTEGGHVVALGLAQAPYPLGGEARDVLEDIHRMGGFAIAAHPTSPKGDLRWTDWTLPVDGLEHLNGDSEWRDESAFMLGRALIAYPFRPAETTASLYDRSEEAFRRWDALTQTRHVVGLPGTDAHGRVAAWRGQEPYRGRLAIPVPGYEPVFRSASVAVPGLHLTRDAVADSSAVLDAIAAGRVYSSVDALAAQPAFEFIATSGQFRAAGGEALTLGGPVRVDVVAQAPPDASIVILRDGVKVLESSAPAARYDAAPAPAVFRAEVRLPGAPGHPPVPWIVSNPIYAGRHDALPPAQDLPQATHRTEVYTDGPAPEWRVEHAVTSRAAVDRVSTVGGTQLLLRYALSGALSAHPYAAMVSPAGPISGHDRLTFTAQADRPMRLSVQLRAESGDAEGERWHRSVFIDTIPRVVTIRFDDMRPRGTTRSPKPRLDDVRWLLFVVDTVNTPVGTAGQVSIDEVRYER